MKAARPILKRKDKVKVPPGSCALGVMTKVPRAGKVKTRLTPPLTPEEAAALNICFLRDTTAAIDAASNEWLSHGIAIYTPTGEENAYDNILPPDFWLIPQRGDGFGERLFFAVQDLLQVGFASVCLIDSDSPSVPQSVYAKAVSILFAPGDRMVFGPSDDGGYYLIGLKRAHLRVFEEIDWSTEHVGRQTLERAREIGLTVELLPTWYDVDDRMTLRRLCDGLFVRSEHAPVTKNFLEQLIAREGRERIWPNE